jgi:hypothetical protein
VSSVRVFFALFLACLLVGAAEVRAEDAFATVVLVTEQDDRGRWRAVATSTRALRERAGEVAALAPGMELALGDVVQTDLARAELRLSTGERLDLAEGTRLTLQSERGVLQELGELYLRLRTGFTVEYGTVDTVVEGTRFVVAGAGEAVRVRVDEGRVRVANPDGAVAVRAGQAVVMPLEGALPTPPQRARPSASELSRSFARGRPVASLGAQAVSELLIDVGRGPADAADLRGSGGLRVSGALWTGPVLRLGVATTLSGAGRGGTRLPQELFAAVELGPVSLGGGPVAIWEQRRLPCGARLRDLHVGGGGFARARLPLGRRLRLTGDLRLGVADTLWTGVGLGAEVWL